MAKLRGKHIDNHQLTKEYFGKSKKETRSEKVTKDELEGPEKHLWRGTRNRTCEVRSQKMYLN